MVDITDFNREAGPMNEAWGARIEGKIDLLNERNSRLIEDITDIRTRQNSHSERLNVLEAASHTESGKREGMATVVKLLWAVVALLLGGGFITIATVLSNMGGFK